MSPRSSLQALAAAALFCLPAIASASIVPYTTLASFNPAVASGSYTEPFATQATVAPTYSFSGGSPVFGYTVSVPVAFNPSEAVYQGQGLIGNNYQNEILNFTPTTANISAFGGNFFITDTVNTFLSVPITLTVTDSLGAMLSQTFTPTSATVGSFRGFVSDGLIVQVALSATGGQYYNTADNIVVGRRLQVAVIPEPGTAALLALGGWFAMLASQAARRRRQAGA